MRKIIAIVAVALVPIGMWTAGCRQDTNRTAAAFPNKSSDLKGLAKADGGKASNKPPRIDPAPIDREILGIPESNAFARADAVTDKSRQMAKPKAPDELFTLPDTGSSMASAYDPRPADIGPASRGGEFWSKPVSSPGFSRMDAIPDDVSAMAPAAKPVDTPRVGSGFMAPPVQFLPPAPEPSSNKPATKGGGFLSLEDVPGTFDGKPLSRRSGSPPASQNTYNAAIPGGDALGAPPPLTKREYATISEKPAPSARKNGPVQLDLSELLGSNPTTESGMPFTTTTAAYQPSPVSYETTAYYSPSPSAINTEIKVQSIPGDYEPLPEPIPLAEYQAMLARSNPMPAKMEMPSRRSVKTVVPKMPPASAPVSRAALPLPEIGKAPERKIRMTVPAAKPAPARKIADTDGLAVAPPAKRNIEKSVAPPPAAPEVKVADMKKALAPLPDLSGKMSPPELLKPDTLEMKLEPVAAVPQTSVALPPPLPSQRAELPGLTPDLLEAKSALGGVSAVETESLKGKDFFKTDFWEKSASGPGFDLELPEPPMPPAMKKKTAEPVKPKPSTSVIAKRVESSGMLDAGKADAGSADLLRPKEPEVIEAAKPPVPEAVPEVKKREATEPPKKVKLQPLRRYKDKGISKIDSEMEVPPMRF